MPASNRHRHRFDRLWAGVRRRMSWRLAGILAAVGLVLLLAGGAVLAFYLAPYHQRAKQFDVAEVGAIEEGCVVYDRDGTVIGSLFVEHRQLVPIRSIPRHLIEALVATEDSRFFNHRGYDPIGITRAALVNWRSDRVQQGASTITQQLARQTFDLRERSVERKLVEVFIARRIEQEFSKEQILEFYLNRIYFGSGFYGIEAAAQGYFGKPVQELSVEEAAVVIGLVKRPNDYSPFRNRELALEGRNHVLRRMRDVGFLDRKEFRTALAKPLQTMPENERSPNGSYVLQEVRRRILRLFPDGGASLGMLHIHTSIDSELQARARRSVTSALDEVELRDGYPHPKRAAGSHDYLQAAAVVIDNATGFLLASVGGRAFSDSEFDRAFHGRRPAGTTFCPIVFAAALDAGVSPNAPIEDAPIDNRKVMLGGVSGVLGEWGTLDPNNSYRGTITARTAIADSKAAATVRLGNEVGLDRFRTFARRAGISSPLREYPASFLGQSVNTPAEIALAFSTFPRGGTRPDDISLITHIKGPDGKILYTAANPMPEAPVIKPLDAYHVHSTLRDSLAKAASAVIPDEAAPGLDVAAGTPGASYGFKDSWFVGYNSTVTCAVWAGFDDATQIAGSARDAQVSLPIWNRIMAEAYTAYSAEPITAPDGAVPVVLCEYTGQKATDACGDYLSKVLPGTGETRLFVASVYHDALSAADARQLTLCQLHSGDALKLDEADGGDGGLVFPKAVPVAGAGGGGPVYGVRPVFPDLPALEGHDPYGSLRPTTIPRAEPVAPDPEPETETATIAEGETADPDTPPSSNPGGTSSLNSYQLWLQSVAPVVSGNGPAPTEDIPYTGATDDPPIPRAQPLNPAPTRSDEDAEIPRALPVEPSSRRQF